MSRAEALLEHAAGVVTWRRREYGEPIDLFEQVAQRWSLTLGTKISPAQVALCLIDLGAEWQVGEAGYESRAENCCFAGRRLRGRVLLTVAGGSIAYRERALVAVGA